MRTIVVYKSKTGFVRKYAEWIAYELGADLFDASEVSAAKLAEYDAIVYGGGLYAVGINGVGLIKKNLGLLAGKKIVVFGTGASTATDKVYAEVRDKNFTADELKVIRYFYLRGGFDFTRLPWYLKGVMNLMKWGLQRKKERTAEEQGMLDAFDAPVDFTDKENIRELVAYIRAK
ncbi:MAG TPA: flavodoxin domain-containing protein [bacterium]|nr:flavodoxin domain-containing protein [bacterium]